MRSERCTQCGRWITDPDTLFLKKYACNYFCSDGCQSAWKRDREYEAQRTRDRLDSNPVHKAAPSITIPGGFCWSVNKNFSAVNVTYGWLENVGDQESEMINIEIYGGTISDEIREKYTIANRLLPGHALRGGNCTIQLPRRITEKDLFTIQIVYYADKNRSSTVYLQKPDGFFDSNIYLTAGWTKKQLKEATKPIAVQIEPPPSKKTAAPAAPVYVSKPAPAPKPVVNPDEPCDAKAGKSSEVSITEPGFSIQNNECTFTAKCVENKSPWGTGRLKLVLWFYVKGENKDAKMAEVELGGLKKGYNYSDVCIKVPLTGNPAPGTYETAIQVQEKHESGNWYVVGKGYLVKWVAWNIGEEPEPQPVTRCPKCNTDAPASMRVCPKCGNKLPEGFVFVEGGSFTTGSEKTDPKARVKATIGDMYVCTHPVTQHEYESIMGETDFYYECLISLVENNNNNPATNICWYDAIEYCNKRSIQEGLSPYYNIDKETRDPYASDKAKGWIVTCNTSSDGYRLPNEEEWEYFARGGKLSRGYLFAGSNDINKVAFYKQKKLPEICQKKPNELGIYDIHLVGEMCYPLREFEVNNKTEHLYIAKGKNFLGSNLDAFKTAIGKAGNGDSLDRKYEFYGFRVVRSFPMQEEKKTQAAQTDAELPKEENVNASSPQPVINNEEPVDAAPKGSDTKVSITGASYSYENGKCTLKAGLVQNNSEHGTGSLKIIFWFSKNGPYNGGSIDAYQMAESLIGEPLGKGLAKGFGYSDVNVATDLTGNPPKGSYQPVITINEKCEDGKWYIVGWANFANPQQWN